MKIKKMKVVVGILLVTNLATIALLVRVVMGEGHARDHHTIVLKEPVVSSGGAISLREQVALIPAEGDDFRYSDLADHRLYKIYVRIPDGVRAFEFPRDSNDIGDDYHGPVIDLRLASEEKQASK